MGKEGSEDKKKKESTWVQAKKTEEHKKLEEERIEREEQLEKEKRKGKEKAPDQEVVVVVTNPQSSPSPDESKSKREKAKTYLRKAQININQREEISRKEKATVVNTTGQLDNLVNFLDSSAGKKDYTYTKKESKDQKTRFAALEINVNKIGENSAQVDNTIYVHQQSNDQLTFSMKKNLKEDQQKSMIDYICKLAVQSAPKAQKDGKVPVIDLSMTPWDKELTSKAIKKYISQFGRSDIHVIGYKPSPKPGG